MDDNEMDDDDEKKKPEITDNVALKAICRKEDDSNEVKCKVHNDTEHKLKFSWGVDNASHGGKVTVDGGSSETFYATADEDATVYLYHDGKRVDSVC